MQTVVGSENDAKKDERDAPRVLSGVQVALRPRKYTLLPDKKKE